MQNDLALEPIPVDGNYRLILGDYRGFTPSDNEEDGGTYGGLAAGATGDWSWKPERDALVGDSFKTFKGVPKSPAEDRLRGPEPGARFYGIPEHMVNETAEQYRLRVLRIA